MYSIGKGSREKLDTCHQDLVTICEEVIKFHDFSVIEGARSTERQQELFSEGKSQLDGVTKKSKHQPKPDENGKMVSYAIDAIPYYKGFNPFTSENGPKSFYFFAGIMLATAETLYSEGKISHKLRWGGNWDSDMDFFSDSKFFDLPHFELIPA